MPVELYYEDGVGRRLRKVTNAQTTGLTEIKSDFYSSIDSEYNFPVSDTPPVISGGPTIGSTLLVTAPGSYAQSVTLTYQWYVNDVAKVGETGTSFDTTGLNGGDVVKVVETATNPKGSSATDSNEITVTV